MGSPKHLWSGDWQEESNAAARRRAAAPLRAPEPPATAAPEPPPATSAPAPAPRPAAQTPPRPPQPRPAATPRPARPRRRRRLSPQELRRWGSAAALALVVGFVAVSAIAMLASGGSKSSAAQTTRGASTAWMGARLRTLPGDGALIENVAANGPAAVAGLMPGDVIIGVDSTSVVSAADVSAVLSGARPGQVLAVHARRGAAGFTAQVTLQTRPAGQTAP